MKYAVVSDVHANVEALSAVIAAIDVERVDAILCLGDVVGYGANPNECARMLASAGAKGVVGNHDRAALGLRDTAHFGLQAQQAMRWTRRLLGGPPRDWLASLPLVRKVSSELLLFHAALHPMPNDELHLSSLSRLEKSLRALQEGGYGARIGLFGHTHHAGAWRARGGAFGPAPGDMVKLDDGAHYLINPGSVGQSRDGDPRAAFAILDMDQGAVWFRRVAYDTTLAMAKVAALAAAQRGGLGAWLAARLPLGRFAGQRR
ncbi:metallophosphoesterase family protein [Polyangium sorediatum]|uniref:Metallophosphoesterase family protein n=1 Tax=Polyangium sorediatum TaxID=889274 RepID=A0ABT6P2A6_9BACT|nr:metallophosphoesterase family protein [Polyangium sorediatum]MDI1434734.1 metallophosphoesterase family protein [Polyangium sorediatum]